MRFHHAIWVASTILFLAPLAGCATTSSMATGQAQGGDSGGLSCQRRVKVPGVPAEYDWIKAHYPGSKVTMQSLAECDGSSTDILHVMTADGRELEVFFDISSFFGNDLVAQ